MRIDEWLLILVAAAGVVALLIHFRGRSGAPSSNRSPWPCLVLNERDRILVLAPHPDDEVLGCGGIIQQAVGMKLPVHIAFLTYGDFYEWSFMIYKKRLVLTAKGVEGMGEIRHDEAVAAAALLGVPPDSLSFFGYPDFGTLEMWRSAWSHSPPVRGLLTRVAAVPYDNAVRPGAPYKAEEVVKDLAGLIREFRPTKLFVSHPADHHPDHRALYLFTRICLFDLEKELSPELYPYLVHHTDWPTPKGHHPDEPLVSPGPLDGPIAWKMEPLDLVQRQAKLAALKEHRSQFKATSRYLQSFVRANELFGDFPLVELAAGHVSHSASHEAPGDTTSDGRVVGREEAALVGVVRESATIENRELVLSLEMSRPLAREVGLSVYLFGYRRDRAFPQMPKLHVKLSLVHHQVYDQDISLASDRIGVTRQGRHIGIRMPLELMGDPERVFASVQAAAGAIPLAWSAWQVFELHDRASSPDALDTSCDSASVHPHP